MDRRHFIFAGSTLALTGGMLMAMTKTSNAAEGEKFEYALSDVQWREKLPPDAYAVLRRESTERAGSSPLDREKGDGVFHCRGCDQALFESKTKFDSGTGWPSFFTPIPGAVATREDRSLFGVRTEVHCSRCGGHLGHVFPDGPAPTGLRYCMNGVAMEFEPG